MNELMNRRPEYREVKIEVIEELKEPEKAEAYDYWYVPRFL